MSTLHRQVSSFATNYSTPLSGLSTYHSTCLDLPSTLRCCSFWRPFWLSFRLFPFPQFRDFLSRWEWWGCYNDAEVPSPCGTWWTSQIWKTSAQIEASYFDPINMTENGLEYDRKKFTPTNVNVGTWQKDYTDKPWNMTEIWLILVIWTRSCSSFWQYLLYFWSSSMGNVRLCEFFRSSWIVQVIIPPHI